MTKNRSHFGRNRLLLGFSFFLAVNLGEASFAQEAPVPRKSPRTPVQKQALPVKGAEPVARDVTGLLNVVDTDHLKIGSIDFRLYGIVPPQLSASYGPQVRTTLDSLTAGQTISCSIRDRARDGLYMAVCRTMAGADLAQELLRRGLAVTARGTLNGTDYATPYIAAESFAQSQRMGVWSVIGDVASVLPKPVLDGINAPRPDAKAEQKPKTDASTTPPLPETQPKQPPKPDPKPIIVEPPIVIDKNATRTTTGVEPLPINTALRGPLSLNPRDLDLVGESIPQPDASTSTRESVFSHYQMLISASIMSVTSLLVILIFALQRRRDHRDELSAIAAALRGELMGARAVCLSRLKKIYTPEDDHATPWPRLRSTLYQAYVGRVGLLGAELARQVASIYGQASDYAAYYRTADPTNLTPKRHAFETLIRHIDSLTPKLIFVEHTGRRPVDPSAPTSWLGRLRLQSFAAGQKPIDTSGASRRASALPKTPPKPILLASTPVPPSPPSAQESATTIEIDLLENMAQDNQLSPTPPTRRERFLTLANDALHPMRLAIAGIATSFLELKTTLPQKIATIRTRPRPHTSRDSGADTDVSPPTTEGIDPLGTSTSLLASLRSLFDTWRQQWPQQKTQAAQTNQHETRPDDDSTAVHDYAAMIEEEIADFYDTDGYASIDDDITSPPLTHPNTQKDKA